MPTVGIKCSKYKFLLKWQKLTANCLTNGKKTCIVLTLWSEFCGCFVCWSWIWLWSTDKASKIQRFSARGSNAPIPLRPVKFKPFQLLNVWRVHFSSHIKEQIISKLTVNFLIDSPNATRCTISEWTVCSVALLLMNNKSICLCSKETLDLSIVFDEMYCNKISEYLMALLKSNSCHFANNSLLLR